MMTRPVSLAFLAWFADPTTLFVPPCSSRRSLTRQRLCVMSRGRMQQEEEARFLRESDNPASSRIGRLLARADEPLHYFAQPSVRAMF